MSIFFPQINFTLTVGFWRHLHQKEKTNEINSSVSMLKIRNPINATYQSGFHIGGNAR